MRRKEISQIVLTTQCAHDLGDGQCGKSVMGLYTEDQEIGQDFDEQSGVQTIASSLHRANLEDRFEHLPETFNQMMLLPYVPDFRASQSRGTKIH